MLIYLLVFGSIGGCLYLLSIAYKLSFKRLNKRKLRDKAEFKKECKGYEERHSNKNT